MAVAHVLTEAHIGDDKKAGETFLQGPAGLLNNAVFGIGAAGLFILGTRDTEKDDIPEAVVHGFGHVLFQFGEGEVVLAGHGPDFFLEGLILGLYHEIGHNQIFHEHGGRLTEEIAHLGRLTQAPATEEVLHCLSPEPRREGCHAVRKRGDVRCPILQTPCARKGTQGV